MPIVVSMSTNWATVDDDADISWLMTSCILFLFQKRKRGISKELEVHQRVIAVVEIVKEQYLVSVLLH